MGGRAQSEGAWTLVTPMTLLRGIVGSSLAAGRTPVGSDGRRSAPSSANSCSDLRARTRAGLSADRRSDQRTRPERVSDHSPQDPQRGRARSRRHAFPPLVASVPAPASPKHAGGRLFHRRDDLAASPLGRGQSARLPRRTHPRIQLRRLNRICAPHRVAVELGRVAVELGDVEPAP